MKIKSLLIGMLASTAFVACTNDVETVENGAKLATILIGNATIAITHDSSVSGSVMEMAVALNGKENSSSNYFATLRLSTSSKDGKEFSGANA